jgi:hypothetical protein
MKLKVLSSYQERDLILKAGQVYECTEAEAKRLMVDSPGSFEIYAEPKQARPTRNKQTRTTRSKSK